MPNIRIDDEVYMYLNNKGKVEDSFNDVLRRELGLDHKKVEYRFKTNMPLHKEDREMLTGIVDKHLPSHWRATSARQKETLMVIERFLETPGLGDVMERELRARKQVAKELNLTAETIQDKYCRQLYRGQGSYILRFRAALEKIEEDFSRLHK